MSYHEALLHHVQRQLMGDLGLTWGEVQLQPPGVIAVRKVGGPVVRVLLGDEVPLPFVRVWATVAESLRPTARVLREVNDVNSSMPGAKLVLDVSGELMAVAEVRAESLEPGELGELVDRVAGYAAEVGEVVQLVLGGHGGNTQPSTGTRARPG